MKITVTQKHINDGRECDCARCPIALAIKDVVPDTFVDVTRHYAYIWAAKYQLPEEAKDFIRNFDMHRPVQPFEFELELKS